MICEDCSEAANTNNMDLHGKCRGGTWCDCQHLRNKRDYNGQRKAENTDSESESKE